MTNWIKISERLPNHNEWVLAFNGRDMCVCWSDVGCSDYLFMYGMSSQQQFNKVTHWMPLPEVPNEAS